MKRVGVLLIAGVGLVGCQVTHTYEPFLPNAENFEVANAKCQMMAGSAEQQIVAWGSPIYVASMQAANAAGNIDRVDRFMMNCMTAQGWRRIAAQPQSNKRPIQAAENEISPEMRRKAVDLLALEEVAAKCKLRLKPDAKARFKELRQVSPIRIRNDAISRAEQSYTEKVKQHGKDGACQQLKKAFREASLI